VAVIFCGILVLLLINVRVEYLYALYYAIKFLSN